MTPSSKDHGSSSSGRRCRGDEEQGGGVLDLCGSQNDTFSIPLPKKATIERLKKWRQATLVLNASRRFRYTLDLKKVKEKEEIRQKIRAHAQAVRAALLFKEAGEKHLDVTPIGLPPAPSGDYRIGTEQLTTITRDHDFSALQQYGGVKGLASLLKTDLEKGIAGEDSELVHRRSVFGANNYPRKKGRSFWVFLWESWQDLTLIILMVAAAVSLALGMKTEGVKEGWYDGGSIAFAVLLVIFVTAFSDYRQSLQFQSLNEEKRNILLEVVRGGRRVHISIFDIVVGDVVPLKIGDQVPADGIFISGHSLAIDESSMTGESKIVHKDTKSPFLMSGCKVADGYGDMLVTAVGLNTEWGLLMASISEDTGEETPLQVRLNGVATFIGIVGLTVASFVLVVLLARYFTGHTTNADGTTQFIKGKTGVSATIDGAVKIVTIAVTIVVVAVPEGLPLAVTLTLAYSMRKMMVDKALVRRLSACETMGSATTICSDKTGTLTLNQMAIVEAYVGGKKLASPDSIQLLSSDVSTLLIEGIAQNTTGNVFVPEDGGAIEITGSPTEKAILSWGVKLGMIFGDIKSKSTVLHVFPFNSEKKRGGVALQVGESEVHIHWKGAAEIVLSSCTSWLDPDGSVKPMDQDKMNEFKNAIEDMAAGSLRCVAFAYRSYGVENVPIDEEQRDQWELPGDELVMMAIVGIKDPCRPGVKDAVQLCTRAGVKVRMVTGDNIQTAKAIALECGILDSEAAAVYPTLIEGKTFRALPDNEREEVAEKISVMGRSSPNDKLLLVKALRKRGHVVAVTGDGTNDAPALHEAGKTFPTLDPRTGEVIAHVAEGDKEDINRAVSAARKAFDEGPWPKMSPYERSKIIYRFADLLEKHKDELAALEVWDAGKPYEQAASAEIPTLVRLFRYYAGWADKIHGLTVPADGPHHVQVLHEPIGVAGQIIPWNFPLLMYAWKVGPALACGNTIVLKTAEQTPLSALYVSQLFHEAGLPPGVLNVISGYGPTAGAALASHMDVDKLAFTGSTDTGKIVLELAARSNLKPVTLELGGKSPFIVCDDANVDRAVEHAHFALFFNQGQCCCAGSRTFVHERVYDEFIEKAKARAMKRVVGDPFRKGVEQGPQIDSEQFEKVMKYIKAGIECGAILETGGERIGSKGYYIQPTVFSDVKDGMPIATDEIFGPVQSILKFRDINEVIQRANATHYGLAAGVFTSNIDTANTLTRALRVGTVWVNCFDVFDAAIPFGGFKMSGHGREKGIYSLNNYLQVKAVVTPLKNPAWL